MPQYLLLYDAACGPCTSFKKLFQTLDAYRRLRPIPLQTADREGLLDPVPLSLRHRSFHLITPSGNIMSGVAAIPALISLLPAGTGLAKLIRVAPGGSRALTFVYNTLSRLHDSGSCSYTQKEENSSRIRNESRNYGILPVHKKSAVPILGAIREHAIQF